MKINKTDGKVLTIFLVIIAILLITLTALSMFFYNVEIDRRKDSEASLSSLEKDYEKLDKEIKEVKKKNFLLNEKNKEADNRINSLLDEVELEKGLREEVKKEALTLKEQLDSFKEDIEKVENQSASQIGDLEQKIVELEARLKVEINRNQELLKQNDALEAARSKLEQMTKQQAAVMSTPAKQTSKPVKKEPPKQITPPKPKSPTTQKTTDVKSQAKITTEKPKVPTKTKTTSKVPEKVDVELDQIVVTPRVKVADDELIAEIVDEVNTTTTEEIPDGRVLSVDVETEFVVINLGEKDGVQKGAFMSVYRGNDYLGDIIITRTQDEMAAADIVPPLSSKMLRKNDQVIAK